MIIWYKISRKLIINSDNENAKILNFKLIKLKSDGLSYI